MPLKEESHNKTDTSKATPRGTATLHFSARPTIPRAYKLSSQEAQLSPATDGMTSCPEGLDVGVEPGALLVDCELDVVVVVDDDTVVDDEVVSQMAEA